MSNRQPTGISKLKLQLLTQGAKNLLKNQLEFNSNKGAPAEKKRIMRRVVHRATFSERMDGLETVSSEVSCSEGDTTLMNDTEKCHKYLQDLQKFNQDGLGTTRNRTF